MSEGWEFFLAGLALGGPAYIAVMVVIFSIQDLWNKLSTAKRRKRQAARDSANLKDLARTLDQAGIEFSAYVAQELVSQGWTK